MQNTATVNAATGQVSYQQSAFVSSSANETNINQQLVQLQSVINEVATKVQQQERAYNKEVDCREAAYKQNLDQLKAQATQMVAASQGQKDLVDRENT